MATAKKTKAPAAKPKPAKSGAADALWEQYCEKPDRELLRVFADALVQAGNPRGTFINLCLVDDPTEEQKAAKATMLSKQKKVLAGPAGEYLREFDFDRNGLVSLARTEFGKVVENPDVFRTLSPSLALTITSVKTQTDAKALGQISLGNIFFVDFGWITGTHGGMQFDQKKLAFAAPAFKNVRHLQLSERGSTSTCFLPAGLRVLGEHATALRYLAIDIYQTGLPPAAEYAQAIGESFEALRGFDIHDVVKAVPGRANIKVGNDLVVGGRFTQRVYKGIAAGTSLADLLEEALR